jgi:hypothetical protein
MLHLGGKPGGVVKRTGLVKEVKFNFTHTLGLIEDVLLGTPVSYDTSILKDGLNDSLVLLKTLLCQGDIHIEVREGSIEFVVMGGT